MGINDGGVHRDESLMGMQQLALHEQGGVMCQVAVLRVCDTNSFSQDGESFLHSRRMQTLTLFHIVLCCHHHHHQITKLSHSINAIGPAPHLFYVVKSSGQPPATGCP
jgi:hypothetical protein